MYSQANLALNDEFARAVLPVIESLIKANETTQPQIGESLQGIMQFLRAIMIAKDAKITIELSP
jgi:hypothetical protein